MKFKKKIRPNNMFDSAMALNDLTYDDYLKRLEKIALSIFEWTDLPESMNQRWLERCLYYKGMAALLKDKNFGFINTGAVGGGYINIYGIPTKVNCFSNGYSEMRDVYMGIEKGIVQDDKAILVMNNWDRVPTCSTIELFAMRLANIQRTIDLNIHAQKTPVLILTDDKQRLTVKNMYEQYDGNAPAIYGDKNILTADALKVLKTDAPYVADKLIEARRDTWNEALTFLGVSNLSEEKKERLIQAEANSNNEVINLNLQSYLAPRKEAARQFNEVFGTKIDVKVRSDLYNIVKQYDNSLPTPDDLNKEVKDE
jgi:hypothetical protein